MFGSRFASIDVWTLPAQMAPFFDHTYVKSSCGYSWGCFGRAEGGRALGIEAFGDSNISECLSNPKSDFFLFAGLRYFIDGVCHQASNRVLDPTGRTLPSTVKGYNISIIRWGQYGRPVWNKEKCYRASEIRRGLRHLLALFQTGMSPMSPVPWSIAMPDDFGSLLQEVFRDDPGLIENPEIKNALSSILQRSSVRQTKLVEDLDAQTISPEQFYDLSVEAHRHSLIEIREVIGESRFKNIFGDHGADPEGLSDRDQFLTSYRNSRL